MVRVVNSREVFWILKQRISSVSAWNNKKKITLIRIRTNCFSLSQPWRMSESQPLIQVNVELSTNEGQIFKHLWLLKTTTTTKRRLKRQEAQQTKKSNLHTQSLKSSKSVAVSHLSDEYALLIVVCTSCTRFCVFSLNFSKFFLVFSFCFFVHSFTSISHM